MSVELRDAANQKLQEIDLIANHSGSLLLIDCKLTSPQDEKEKITSQIRQAGQTRTRLGGLGAKMLLLRPNRPLSEGQQALCQVNRLTTIDQSGAWNLLSGLARFVGVEPPAHWKALEEQLQAQRERGTTRAFCTEPKRLRDLRSQESHILINLDGIPGEKRHTEINYYRGEAQQDWALTETDGQLTLYINKSPDASRQDVHHKLQPVTDQIEISRSKSSGHYIVGLSCANPQQRSALLQRLAAHTGRSFWD